MPVLDSPTNKVAADFATSTVTRTTTSEDTDDAKTMVLLMVTNMGAAVAAAALTCHRVMALLRPDTSTLVIM